MNSKIVSIKRFSAIFLAIVLFSGTITLSSQSLFMTEAQAQQYYDEMDNNNYKKSYDRDNRDKSKDSSSKSVSINKLKCINTNLNINGENAGNVSIGNKGQGYLGTNSYGAGYYDGYGNNKQGKGFDDCVINNNNTNTNIVSTIPPEPTTATLTVKKQVFGCNFFSTIEMNCLGLQNNSSGWLDCNTNSNISGSVFCQSLPENIFDIEVLDDQNTPIQQFVGSEQGTTIENLEPGTYTVNEIEHLSNINQLGENVIAEGECINLAGFPDGGIVINSTANIVYAPICFEYEDEQGNDCNTITLAAGEERTCIVKNYIRYSEVI